MHVGRHSLRQHAVHGRDPDADTGHVGPTWNNDIYNLLQSVQGSAFYTPGDNEWTDCHKTKEFTSGAPLNECRAVRNLFFASPGYTAWRRKKQVHHQRERLRIRALGRCAVRRENVMWAGFAGPVRDAQCPWIRTTITCRGAVAPRRFPAARRIPRKAFLNDGRGSQEVA
jgi:hypothetical protein